MFHENHAIIIAHLFVIVRLRRCSKTTMALHAPVAWRPRSLWYIRLPCMQCQGFLEPEKLYRNYFHAYMSLLLYFRWEEVIGYVVCKSLLLTFEARALYNSIAVIRTDIKLIYLEPAACIFACWVTMSLVTGTFYTLLYCLYCVCVCAMTPPVYWLLHACACSHRNMLDCIPTCLHLIYDSLPWLKYY